MPAGITLTVTGGPHKGRKFQFHQHDNFLVGRSKQAHFQLASKDRYFSRIHFLIELNPPLCRLLDMASRNGTYVNGKSVASIDLKDGDKIQAGKTILRVRIQQPPPPAPVSTREPTSDRPSLVPGRASQAIYRTLTPLLKADPLPQPAPLAVPPDSPPGPPCLVCNRPTSAAQGKHSMPLCPDWLTESQKLQQRIDGYQLVRLLGRGGMGVVYLAVDCKKAELVALKTLIPVVNAGQDEVERFLREARILGELRHPHIVGYRDMGDCRGTLYFIMDYVPGIDAARLLKKEGPLAVGRAVRLTCQLLEALAYARARGFVHRDIKPANLLLAQENGLEMARLADFGLARVYQASQLSGLTLMGEMGGTPGFMPPEQIVNFRDAKPPADQYSTAATLYNLLTNAHIHDFEGPMERQLLKVIQEDAVSIQERHKDIPAELAKVLQRALCREPAKRFPDVEAMRKALAKFASGS